MSPSDWESTSASCSNNSHTVNSADWCDDLMARKEEEQDNYDDSVPCSCHVFAVGGKCQSIKVSIITFPSLNRNFVS